MKPTFFILLLFTTISIAQTAKKEYLLDEND